MDPILQKRFEAAIAEGTLNPLARAFKADGMSKDQVYELFMEVLRQHLDDPDESVYDALADTMDAISGYCHPSCWIFD